MVRLLDRRYLENRMNLEEYAGALATILVALGGSVVGIVGWLMRLERRLSAVNEVRSLVSDQQKAQKASEEANSTFRHDMRNIMQRLDTQTQVLAANMSHVIQNQDDVKEELKEYRNKMEALNRGR
jgi:phage shock protein A